jgi:hydroxypyruvate reductase
MLSPEAFSTRTLRQHPRGADIQRILAAALQAVEPGTAVRRFVQRVEGALLVDGQAYPLDKIGRVRVLGLGKAASAMTRPIVEMLAGYPIQGLLVPKHAPKDDWPGFTILPGGHPVPDERSLAAGIEAMELVRGLDENDLLICLVSGGGSALMSAPLPGIGLADLQALTSALLACGARIDEINTLRRRLDRLKGGGLARMAAPARVISLILSDVIGDPLQAIASGPTAPDPLGESLRGEPNLRDGALAILERYGLRPTTPPAILQTLASAALESASETPKPGDPLFDRLQNVIVGSNALAVQAALEQAHSLGFSTCSLGSDWQGEARRVALELCRRLINAPEKRPVCLVAGGETTVTLRGGGRGGRNQELALAAVNELAGAADLLLVALATDGEDGPTDAAGAVVGGETLRRGQAAGLSPQPFLDDNDAYTYFSALDDLLKPGPTGTNVNDLAFLFAF